MKKRATKTKIIKLTPRQQREADALVKFIDAHGGRLGAFRGYGVAQREQVRPPSTPPASPGERV